jgi:hypothetical protein
MGGAAFLVSNAIRGSRRRRDGGAIVFFAIDALSLRQSLKRQNTTRF